jgi:hypothetical protein
LQQEIKSAKETKTLHPPAAERPQAHKPNP